MRLLFRLASCRPRPYLSQILPSVAAAARLVAIVARGSPMIETILIVVLLILLSWGHDRD